MARVRTNTRVIAIILALILAGVAAVALLSYIRGIEAETAAEFEPVDAFVATETIPAGTTAEQAVASGLIEPRSIPEAAVPEGAITSTAQIEGTVAVVDIVPDEVIVASRFGDTTQAARPLREIPEDKEAISVQVGVVPGVAGFITPGDQVSVIAQLELPVEEEDEEVAEDEEEAAEPEPESSIPLGLTVQYLIQDVEVLAVGRRVIQEGEEQVQQTEAVLLTLAVDADQAEQLTFATLNGTLYFTLLPDEPVDPAPDTPGRTIENIFE